MTQNAPAHTPGPWTWQQVDNHFEIDSDTFRWSAVATVEPNRLGSREVDHSEAEANARLIAAAPDLLAACKQLVEEYERGPQWVSEDTIDRAVRAIISATGN